MKYFISSGFDNWSEISFDEKEKFLKKLSLMHETCINNGCKLFDIGLYSNTNSKVVHYVCDDKPIGDKILRDLSCAIDIDLKDRATVFHARIDSDASCFSSSSKESTGHYGNISFVDNPNSDILY